MMRDFAGRHVVVTGGSGALGQAVVERLVGEGATIHVPCVDPAEAAKLGRFDASSARVSVTGTLADDGAVGGFYGALPSLWASIQIVGGFGMSRIDDTSRAGPPSHKRSLRTSRARASGSTPWSPV